jgi:hypothetical protein
LTLSPVDLAVHTTIMIPTAMPSTVVIRPDHYGSIPIFAVSACKSAIMVSVTNSDIDTLGECWDCNAQSNNHRNNKQAVAHCTFPSI